MTETEQTSVPQAMQRLAPQNVRSLGHASARAIALFATQAVVTKTVTMAAQIALARILVPSDVGLFGLYQAIAAVFSLAQQTGLREVLVQDPENSDRSINAAFWLSTTAGLVSGGAMIALAPTLAAFYSQPLLIGLLAYGAIMQPIQGMTVILIARLQVQLQFRAISFINILVAVASNSLAIVLALSGAGAYSLLWPALLLGVPAILLYLRLGRPRLARNPQFAAWPGLIKRSRYLIASGLFFTLMGPAEFLILGTLVSEHVLGLYFVAATLCMQAMGFILASLGTVLFPVLSRLKNEPKRQANAFLHATRVLAVVAMPACLLLAVCAEPILHLLYGSRWEGAALLCQVLSAAAAIRVVGSPSGALIQAQGRFKTLLVIGIAYFTTLIICLLVGATNGTAVGVAAGAAVGYILIDTVNIWVAIAPTGGTALDVVRHLWQPLTCSFGAAIPGYLAINHFFGMADPLRILIATAVMAACYAILLRLLAPKLMKEAKGALTMALTRSTSAQNPVLKEV